MPSNRLRCLINTGTPTADVPCTHEKVIVEFNIVNPRSHVHDHGYLQPLPWYSNGTPKYMRMPLKIISQNIIDHYNLNKIATDGWVYQNIVHVYGIPIAGKIANDLLTKRISNAGYHPCQFTPGLWKHMWRPVTFTLVVDDASVKFVDKHHAQHL